MSETCDYVYAQGDLLEDRNTYQYSSYHGHAFIKAWENHRRDAQADLGSAANAPRAHRLCLGSDRRVYHTALLLERLAGYLDGDRSLADEHADDIIHRLVKVFEVHKRLYSSFDPRFKPVNPNDYKKLDLYLRFAEIIEQAYRRDANLIYLNVLLKVMDTLVACRFRLGKRQKQRLSRLINCEQEHIGALAQTCGAAR